jgi:hypothetical protein
MDEIPRKRLSLSNLRNARIDWSLKTPAAKLYFVVTILGEIAIGAALIYAAFFANW